MDDAPALLGLQVLHPPHALAIRSPFISDLPLPWRRAPVHVYASLTTIKTNGAINMFSRSARFRLRKSCHHLLASCENLRICFASSDASLMALNCKQNASTSLNSERNAGALNCRALLLISDCMNTHRMRTSRRWREASA